MSHLNLHDHPLARVLRRDILDCARTRDYQEHLDAAIDILKAQWDIGSGTALKGEAFRGRESTAPLCIAAFCWYSPLSRHCGDPALLAFFKAGLQTFLDLIEADMAAGAAGLNGEVWAHGWDLEGLVYGMIFCREELDEQLLQCAAERFERRAKCHAGLLAAAGDIGSIGNQRCVWILGLYLYGLLLDDTALLELAQQQWDNVREFVLNPLGDVFEQYGPCMHYSYTGFFYVWLNYAVRGDTRGDATMIKALDWFRWRHTESLYPIAGPSSRQYYEVMTSAARDLIPAAEQFAAQHPAAWHFAGDAVAAAARFQQAKAPATPKTTPGPTILAPAGHGASPWMWAILMANVVDVAPAPVESAVTQEYRTSRLLKRAPLSYLIVRHKYQTQYTYTDFMPFAGLQTWAWGNEPPLVHPTPLAPSTTVGAGLDTARHGVSHNWGLYGAGAIALDNQVRPFKNNESLRLVVSRYGWLWRLLFFTTRSTVILEFGQGGERQTYWTLNRVEAAAPTIMGDGRVAFAGRRGMLHTTLAEAPQLVAADSPDPWLREVRQLHYACGAGPAAFAFSDETFRFSQPPPHDAAPWRFADGDGLYEVTLDPRFFDPNPGNIRVDSFQLANGTGARVVDPAHAPAPA